MTTNCIDPNEIRDGDLMAYAEGEASARVKDHVSRCEHCAALAARYGRIDRALQAGLHRANCPSAGELARWQLLILRQDEELRVAAHVRTCPRCQREAMELEAAGDTKMSILLDRLKDATRWLVARRAVAPQTVRGGLPPQQRYQVERLDVFVGPMVVGDQRQLRGRLRPAAPDVTVWLISQDLVPRSCPTDEAGAFVFPDVAPGRYDLGLLWQRQAVLLRDVAV